MAKSRLLDTLPCTHRSPGAHSDAPRAGLEPTTIRVIAGRSTVELSRIKLDGTVRCLGRPQHLTEPQRFLSPRARPIPLCTGSEDATLTGLEPARSTVTRWCSTVKLQSQDSENLR